MEQKTPRMHSMIQKLLMMLAEKSSSNACEHFQLNTFTSIVAVPMKYIWVCLTWKEK